MQLARNLAVLLLALAGVSSAAVDRRDEVMRSRHLHAARDYSLRGIVEDLHDLVNLGDPDPDPDNSSTSTTTTTTTSTTTTPDSTSTTTTAETTTESESSTSSTTEPDSSSSSSSTTSTTTAAPSSTPPPDCEPLVVLGVTLSACDGPSSTTTTTTTTSTPPPESTPDPTPTEDPTTTTDPPKSTTDVPEPTITEDPTTTTTSTEAPESTKPGDECTPQVVLGITISACDPQSTAEPTTTTTEQPTVTQPPTDPEPTTTSPPGTTTTVPPDPCDPGLLDPLLGGVLPGFCTQNPTSDPPHTETTEQPPDTTTRPGGEDSTTPYEPPTTTNPDQGSSTSDQPTLDPPTDVFPTESETDDPPTYSSSPTGTHTWSNSNSIPTYLTNTELGLDTPTATSSGVFETDPDAVPTATNPESQQDQPTDVPTLPNNMPNYILSSNAPTSIPSGMTLVTIMLRPELNWWHVVNHPEVAVQLITYGGIMIADALNIPQDQVIVLALQAWIPSPYDGNPRNLLTLIKVYVPSNLVDQLQLILLSPNSAMYTQQREPVAKTLVMYIDPSFPLTSGGSGGSGGGGSPNGSEAGGNLDDLLDNGDDGDAARTKAIIGVCVAVGALLLIGLVWWGYKNYKLKQEQAHRRLSQNSDTQFASGINVPTYGAVGGMAERARQRDSFFFAEDSLRGYEADRRFDEGETYDHRSMAGTAGGALSSRTFSGQHGGGGGGPGGAQYGGQPIQPGAISAPILRENTLNW